MLGFFHFIDNQYWLYRKKVNKSQSNSSLSDFLILTFLTLVNAVCHKIYDLLPFITRFYPFSLIYKDKLFHYDHRKIKKIIDAIEREMDKIHKPIIFLFNRWDRYFLTIKGKMMGKTKITDPALYNLVKKRFNLRDSEFYVRSPDKDTKEILIDVDTVNKIYSS